MPLPSSTETQQCSPAPTAPATTSAALLERGESSWTTCGYVDGDTKSPLELVDGLICQSTSGVMMFCGTDGVPSCEAPHSLCYDESFTPKWACDATPCPPQPSDELWCNAGTGSACALQTWTDIEVSRYFCASDALVQVLSFSHPETTDSTETTDTSGRSTNTASTRTHTATVTAAAATSSSSKHKYFTASETAGLIIGLVVAVAFLTGAIFTFFRKRRDAVESNKAHTNSMIEKSATNGDLTAAQAREVHQQNGSHGPPEEKPTGQGHAGAVAATGATSSAIQPLPPSTATSTMVSPNISPIHSPAISPVAHVRPLNAQGSTRYLSAVPSQFTTDADRASYVTMPPFPITPPPDRRFSPSLDNNAPNHIMPSRMTEAPIPASGNTTNGSAPYTSVYGGYAAHLSNTSDPRLVQPTFAAAVNQKSPLPQMTSSWFQDRDSMASEMDAAGAAAAHGTAAQNKKGSMAGMIELMGSVPGQAR